jgi:hypothetical protein
MKAMNQRKLSVKWNSKYLCITVPHSAISTGFEYLLWHNVPVITNKYKLRLQKIMY